jgi:hypothetical protein
MSELTDGERVSATERKNSKGFKRVRTMANAIKKTALVVVFGIAASAMTFAQDWRDVNKDRHEIRSEQNDIRQDYGQLQRDERTGNWRAVQRDRADIARDQAEMRNERRDVRHDRRDRDGYWGYRR